MDADLKKLTETTAAETRRHFEVVSERLETKIVALADGANQRITKTELLANYVVNEISDLQWPITNRGSNDSERPLIDSSRRLSRILERAPCQNR